MSKLLASIGALAWACLGILLVMLIVLVPAFFALRAVGVPSDFRVLCVLVLGATVIWFRPSLLEKLQAVLDRLIFPFGSPLEIMRKGARGQS